MIIDNFDNDNEIQEYKIKFKLKKNVGLFLFKNFGQIQRTNSIFIFIIHEYQIILLPVWGYILYIIINKYQKKNLFPTVN